MMRVSLDRIVIATGNPHKVEELRAILGRLDVEALALSDLGAYDEPVETGDTFEANASLKALSYVRGTGLPCLADDSGLEIDALGGAPGVISSHYCTNGRDAGMSRAERDELNNERVLRELEGVPPEERTARFVCVMALAGMEPPPKAGGTGVSPMRVPVQDRLTTSRRDLPHWQRGGSTYFITFRTATTTLTDSERQIVMESCQFIHTRRAWVSIAVVMPDHVYLLLKPMRLSSGEWLSLSSILHSVKSFTAHRIQKQRGHHGPLWQDESYDRIVRDAEEFDEKREYIRLNPVRAGLVDDSRDYRFLWIPEPMPAAHRRDARATLVPKLLARTRGTFEGRIGLPGEVPRGDNGFGYDPIFLVAPEFDRTSAELAPDEKNRRSHRAVAAQRMAAELRKLLQEGA
jgi:putative transposase